MDLKRFESVVHNYRRVEDKKKRGHLIISGNVSTSPRDLRSFARHRGLDKITIS